MFDTSCMVAIISRFHPGHLPAVAECHARLGRGEALFVAAPSLAETYAVLTRSPVPLFIAGELVLEALEHGFVSLGEVVALEPAEYLATLRAAVVERVSGGRVYDALIAACAKKATVDVLLTFNERHFRQFEGNVLSIEVPTAAS